MQKESARTCSSPALITHHCRIGQRPQSVRPLPPHETAESRLLSHIHTCSRPVHFKIACVVPVFSKAACVCRNTNVIGQEGAEKEKPARPGLTMFVTRPMLQRAYPRPHPLPDAQPPLLQSTARAQRARKGRVRGNQHTHSRLGTACLRLSTSTLMYANKRVRLSVSSDSLPSLLHLANDSTARQLHRSSEHLSTELVFQDGSQGDKSFAQCLQQPTTLHETNFALK